MKNFEMKNFIWMSELARTEARRVLVISMTSVVDESSKTKETSGKFYDYIHQ